MTGGRLRCPTVLVFLLLSWACVAAPSRAAEYGVFRVPEAALEPVAWGDLDGWAADDHAAGFSAFLASCRALLPNPDPQPVQRALIAVGVACLVFYSVVTVHTWRYQRAANSEIDRLASTRRAEPVAAIERDTRPVTPLATGDLIGKVEIPRLGISAAVAEGDDDKTLRKAVGHLPDTPLPWQRSGNVALAAHRDGLFRRLENIRLDDAIRMVTPRGEFEYRVTKTHIVDPGDVWVIAPTAVPTITLITCYPFSFVGNAPRRFIVQAQLVQKDLGGTPLKGSVVR